MQSYAVLQRDVTAPFISSAFIVAEDERVNIDPMKTVILSYRNVNAQLAVPETVNEETISLALEKQEIKVTRIVKPEVPSSIKKYLPEIGSFLTALSGLFILAQSSRQRVTPEAVLEVASMAGLNCLFAVPLFFEGGIPGALAVLGCGEGLLSFFSSVNQLFSSSALMFSSVSTQQARNVLSLLAKSGNLAYIGDSIYTGTGFPRNLAHEFAVKITKADLLELKMSARPIAPPQLPQLNKVFQPSSPEPNPLNPKLPPINSVPDLDELIKVGARGLTSVSPLFIPVLTSFPRSVPSVPSPENWLLWKRVESVEKEVKGVSESLSFVRSNMLFAIMNFGKKIKQVEDETEMLKTKTNEVSRELNDVKEEVSQLQRTVQNVQYYRALKSEIAEVVDSMPDCCGDDVNTGGYRVPLKHPKLPWWVPKFGKVALPPAPLLALASGVGSLVAFLAKLLKSSEA